MKVLYQNPKTHRFSQHGRKRNAVLTIQCNRLRGGLAINIVGNHQVPDGTGQEQLVHLLDKACRGEAFDEEEIATANLDGTAIIQPVRLGLAAARSIPCTSKTIAAVNPRHKARKRFPRGHACRRVGQPGLLPNKP